MPQTRSGTPRRRDLTLTTLEERHELFQRAGEISRAGYLSGWILCLQEAIECGDERAGDVVALQAHERAGVRICPRGKKGLPRGTVREAVQRMGRNLAARAICEITYPSRYSRMMVLSLRARGGVYVFSLSPGTRPLGETSRRSLGFLYGSTSSARPRQPRRRFAVKKRETVNSTILLREAQMDLFK